MHTTTTRTHNYLHTYVTPHHTYKHHHAHTHMCLCMCADGVARHGSHLERHPPASLFGGTPHDRSARLLPNVCHQRGGARESRHGVSGDAPRPGCCSCAGRGSSAPAGRGARGARTSINPRHWRRPPRGPLSALQLDRARVPARKAPPHGRTHCLVACGDRSPRPPSRGWPPGPIRRPTPAWSCTFNAAPRRVVTRIEPLRNTERTNKTTVKHYTVN